MQQKEYAGVGPGWIEGQEGQAKGSAVNALWAGSAWILGQLNQDTKLQLLTHKDPHTVSLAPPLSRLKFAEESLPPGTFIFPN